MRDKVTMWAVVLAQALSVVYGLILYEDAKALGQTGDTSEIGWFVWWGLCVPFGLVFWVRLVAQRRSIPR